MVSSSGNVSGNECGSAGEQINLRGGRSLGRPAQYKYCARARLAKPPRKNAPPSARTWRGRLSKQLNMLEIASAVLFENFNCIVELSHECFSLPENDS